MPEPLAWLLNYKVQLPSFIAIQFTAAATGRPGGGRLSMR